MCQTPIASSAAGSGRSCSTAVADRMDPSGPNRRHEARRSVRCCTLGSWIEDGGLRLAYQLQPERLPNVQCFRTPNRRRERTLNDTPPGARRPPPGQGANRPPTGAPASAARQGENTEHRADAHGTIPESSRYPLGRPQRSARPSPASRARGGSPVAEARRVKYVANRSAAPPRRAHPRSSRALERRRDRTAAAPDGLRSRQLPGDVRLIRMHFSLYNYPPVRLGYNVRPQHHECQGHRKKRSSARADRPQTLRLRHSCTPASRRGCWLFRLRRERPHWRPDGAVPPPNRPDPQSRTQAPTPTNLHASTDDVVEFDMRSYALLLPEAGAEVHGLLLSVYSRPPTSVPSRSSWPSCGVASQ
jgi:hypothetical protein